MTITTNFDDIDSFAKAADAMNEIADHLRGDVLPLNAAGQTATGGAALGSIASPFAALYARRLFVGADGTNTQLDISQLSDRLRPTPDLTGGSFTWPYSTFTRALIIATFNYGDAGASDADRAMRTGRYNLTGLAQGRTVDWHQGFFNAFREATVISGQTVIRTATNINGALLIPAP